MLDLWASRDLDYTGRSCMEPLSVCILVVWWSPSASAVQDDAATLFCCEAPEMFRGLRRFTRLSLAMGVTGSWLNLNLWENSSFKAMCLSVLSHICINTTLHWLVLSICLLLRDMWPSCREQCTGEGTVLEAELGQTGAVWKESSAEALNLCTHTHTLTHQSSRSHTGGQRQQPRQPQEQSQSDSSDRFWQKTWRGDMLISIM